MTNAPAGTAFREAATRIGRRLCRDAVWDGDCCTWLTWGLPGSHAVPVYRSCPGDFFSGTAGIGLFLWYLQQLVPDPQIRRTSEAAQRHADRQAPGTRNAATPRPASGTDQQALDELRRWLKGVEAGSAGHSGAPEHAATYLTERLQRDPHAMTFTSSMGNGWCGMCDALLWYEQYRPAGTSRPLLMTVAASACQRSAAGIPWPCGGATGVETPDLLHGLAGTGWCYLRLADPSSIPSPFALAEVEP